MIYDKPLKGEITTGVYMYVCRACCYFVEYDCQCGYPADGPPGYQSNWAGFATLEDAVAAQAEIAAWSTLPTPAPGHAADCDWHCDQNPHECTCGLSDGAGRVPSSTTDASQALGIAKNLPTGRDGEQ